MHEIALELLDAALSCLDSNRLDVAAVHVAAAIDEVPAPQRFQNGAKIG